MDHAKNPVTAAIPHRRQLARLSLSVLFIALAATGCERSVMPGRTFFQTGDCRGYEEVVSGFQSAIGHFLIECQIGGEIVREDVLWDYSTRYYTVDMTAHANHAAVTVDYCPIGQMPEASAVIDSFTTNSPLSTANGGPIDLEVLVAGEGCAQDILDASAPAN